MVVSILWNQKYTVISVMQAKVSAQGVKNKTKGKDDLKIDLSTVKFI